ncbi:MAG: chain-length determining protein, partial [Muribaculaceae bacterium]|nr:chain-length determining protein [Muribaculaceae bacterium]
KYIAEYRTSKAVQSMNYAQKLNDEARADYYAAQQRYADYVDKNQNVMLNSRRIEEERLRNEVTLAFNLYNSTSTLLQQAVAKVQEDMPVYAVIQPATVPLEPSTSRIKKLIIFAFLGILISGVWVVFSPIVKETLAKIKNR